MSLSGGGSMLLAPPGPLWAPAFPARSPFGDDVWHFPLEDPGLTDGELFSEMTRRYGELPIRIGAICGLLYAARYPSGPIAVVYRQEVICSHIIHSPGKPLVKSYDKKTKCGECDQPLNRAHYPCLHDLGLFGGECAHGSTCDKVHFDTETVFCKYGLMGYLSSLHEDHPELFGDTGSGDPHADRQVWVDTHEEYSRRHAASACPNCDGNGLIVDFSATGMPRRANYDPSLVSKILSEFAMRSMCAPQ
jgi:hypothetical protein